MQRARGGVHKRRSFVLHRKVERHDALLMKKQKQKKNDLVSITAALAAGGATEHTAVTFAR